MRYLEETVKRERSIELIRCWAKTEPKEDAFFLLYDGEGGVDSYETEEEGLAELRTLLVKTPNWEMQAEYDEMHGTVNGEDLGVTQWKEEIGI